MPIRTGNLSSATVASPRSPVRIATRADYQVVVAWFAGETQREGLSLTYAGFYLAGAPLAAFFVSPFVGLLLAVMRANEIQRVAIALLSAVSIPQGLANVVDGAVSRAPHTAACPFATSHSAFLCYYCAASPRTTAWNAASVEACRTVNESCVRA